MTAEEVLVSVVELAPEELQLLDTMIHALMQAFAGGQTREQAVQAARDAARAAVDALEAAAPLKP